MITFEMPIPIGDQGCYVKYKFPTDLLLSHPNNKLFYEMGDGFMM